MNLTDAIRALYAEVRAPEWAAANLDGLVDVLRDLSWLPPATVTLSVPDVPGADGDRLREALGQAVAETAGGPRPIRITS